MNDGRILPEPAPILLAGSLAPLVFPCVFLLEVAAIGLAAGTWHTDINPTGLLMMAIVGPTLGTPAMYVVQLTVVLPIALLLNRRRWLTSRTAVIPAFSFPMVTTVCWLAWADKRNEMGDFLLILAIPASAAVAGAYWFVHCRVARFCP